VVRKPNHDMNALFEGLNPRETGTHKFTFLAALRCREHGLTPERAEEIINAQEDDMPRYFKDGEVAEAVSSAYGSEGGKPSGPEWPRVNKTRQQQIIKAAPHITVSALQQCSPAATDKNVAGFLQELFLGDPLICSSFEINKGTHTASLSTHVRSGVVLDYSSFVVPNAMRAERGLTLSGRKSRRCLDNTGPRQHIVVEIDDPEVSKDAQAAILNHLAQFAPMVIVVDSAGKSLHGWFACHGGAEEIVRRFFAEAVALGADPAAWNKCQLVRMPNGIRRIWGGKHKTPQRQRVVYFNPNNRTPRAPLPASGGQP
jgi:hypothetical protein